MKNLVLLNIMMYIPEIEINFLKRKRNKKREGKKQEITKERELYITKRKERRVVRKKERKIYWGKETNRYDSYASHVFLYSKLAQCNFFHHNIFDCLMKSLYAIVI